MAEQKNALVNKKRAEWEDYHQKIKEYYFNYIDENGKAPTQKNMAEKTGYAIATINSHMKHILGADLVDYAKGYLPLIERKLREEILNGTADSGTKKLWLEKFGGLSDRKIIESTNRNESISLKFDDLTLDEVKQLLGKKDKKEIPTETEYEEIEETNENTSE